jgi:hypothetical protein
MAEVFLPGPYLNYSRKVLTSVFFISVNQGESFIELAASGQVAHAPDYRAHKFNSTVQDLERALIS